MCEVFPASGVSGRDQSFESADRMRRRVDFEQCYKRGRKLHGAHLTLHIGSNEVGHARLGLTVGRKVGKAVTRQKLKRRLREIFRRWPERKKLPGMDFVVHLKPSAAVCSFEVLSNDLGRTLTTVISRTGRPK